MRMVIDRTQCIGIEAQCWLLTAFAELDRVATLPTEEHQRIQSAIKERHPEGIARAFESAGESLGELRNVAGRLAQAVRFGQLPTLRRLVFEIARA